MKNNPLRTGTIAGVIVVLLWSSAAQARYTTTAPKGTFILDNTFFISQLSTAYDNNGNARPLIDPIYRYEPGGGLQGIIIPDVKVNFYVYLLQLMYGVTDSFSVGIGIPIVLKTTVRPNLGWVPGDYQWNLGRAYSESDFWQWAASMGQSRPGSWSGNNGVLGDLVLGIRWRFTDLIRWCRANDLFATFSIMGAIPTGRHADAENLLSVGTNMWDLYSQGELAIHLSIEKGFPKKLDNRLFIGVDVFYEVFFPHTYTTPKGTENPLLLTYQPYVGDTYVIDPGDFVGAAIAVDIVPVKGPALGTWISGHDKKKAAKMPPMLTLNLEYRHVHTLQSWWRSKSAIWDWDREKAWRPGYKNVLAGKVTLSLLRVGVPFDLYAGYRNQTWIGGKNTRASNVVIVGIRFPLKFW